jgi:hypothetical protein
MPIVEAFLLAFVAPLRLIATFAFASFPTTSRLIRELKW